MEQNRTNETKTPIYGSDLLKLFVNKLKKMLIIGLVAAIIGGGVGVLFTALGNEYKAEINISVSTLDDSDTLLFNLRSGRFAETLLLEKNGLPEKNKCNEADYEAAVKALDELEAVRAKRLEKYLEMIHYHVTDIESAYKRLNSQYEEALALLRMYKDADGEGFANNEDHLKMIALCEENLLAIQAKKNEYYNAFYLPAEEQKAKLNVEYNILTDEVSAARKVADEAVEKVLEGWRNDPEVQKDIKRVMNSVDYNYFEFELPEEDEKTSKATDRNEKLRKGYIKGELVVSAKNKEFAEDLIEAYKMHICDYVENQAEVISGYPNVNVVIIDPVITLNPTVDLIMCVIEAVKYALVAGIAAVIISYLVFMCKMIVGTDKKESTENND